MATISDAGAVFGEMSVLLDLPHTATVRARTPVVVRAPEDATAFLRQHPRFEQLVSASGLPAFWQEQGVADICAAEPKLYGCKQHSSSATKSNPRR